MFPNFFILGAAKAGTTSLYYYLKQHPDIFMPEVKEPGFFTYYGRALSYCDPFTPELARKAYQHSRHHYEALFEGAEPFKRVGEASTLYLYEPGTAAQLKQHVPDARFIVLLRNPVERAYSQYLHLVRDGREPLDDFGKALEAEEGRILEGYYPSYHYQSAGRYHEQLTRYYQLFDSEQVCVILYDDFRRDERLYTQRIYRFLGVDPNFVPDTTLKLNASGLPKSRLLHNFVTRPHPLKKVLSPLLTEKTRLKITARLNKGNLSQAPRLATRPRRSLQRAYRQEVDDLQTLLDKDLSHWLAAA